MYRWLLRAKVPLEFAIGNVFWDGVKRFLFTPCCLFYGVLPVAAAGWAASSCSAAPMLHQLLLSALLVVPNIATAFVFQSFMISVAATVRRKLHAMKALSHMLSPVRPPPLGGTSLHRKHTRVGCWSPWLCTRMWAHVRRWHCRCQALATSFLYLPPLQIVMPRLRIGALTHRPARMQLGSLVVGLPTVTLQRPQTLVAWLRLRTFAQSSFEFPEMIRVEAGFTAIVLLVIVLQVRRLLTLPHVRINAPPRMGQSSFLTAVLDGLAQVVLASLWLLIRSQTSLLVHA